MQRKRPAGIRGGPSCRARRGAYFFLSSFLSPSSRPPCPPPSRRPRGCAAPSRRRRRRGRARPRPPPSACFLVVLDLRLRHDRRRDHRIELAARHDRHARRELERRDVDRMADVELDRSTSMNSGRSFGRHEMSSSVSHVADDRAGDLHRRRDLAVRRSAAAPSCGSCGSRRRAGSRRAGSRCLNGCICTSRSSTFVAAPSSFIVRIDAWNASLRSAWKSALWSSSIGVGRDRAAVDDAGRLAGAAHAAASRRGLRWCAEMR